MAAVGLDIRLTALAAGEDSLLVAVTVDRQHREIVVAGVEDILPVVVAWLRCHLRCRSELRVWRQARTASADS